MKLRRIKEFGITQYKIILGNRFGTVGALIIVFFCTVGLLAPILAPHAPWDTLRDANGKLAIMRPPSLEFPLGTTALGRDILTQMLFATRTYHQNVTADCRVDLKRSFHFCNSSSFVSFHPGTKIQ